MKLAFTLLSICFTATIFSQNIEAALQGKVTDSSKIIHQNKNFIINCGCGNKNQKHLFFIDGVISDSVNLANFKPNDIESLEIVKSALSEKLFGERGKDGAIIIYMKEKSDSSATHIMPRPDGKIKPIPDPAPRTLRELFFVVDKTSQDSVKFNNNSLDAFNNGIKRTIGVDEIEKSELLTNVMSAAIYGVRGANGAVVVTTSKPSKAKYATDL